MFKSVNLNKLNKGLHVANQANPNAKTSIRSLMGVLKDDDMNRSLTYILNLLKGCLEKINNTLLYKEIGTS